MRPEMREFLEQEETGAARSKQAKAARRKKRNAKFGAYLARKAEQLEANGNPRAAKAFREFWRKFAHGIPDPAAPPEDGTNGR